MRQFRPLLALVAVLVAVGTPVHRAWAVPFFPLSLQIVSLGEGEPAGSLNFPTAVAFVPPGFPMDGTLHAGDVLVADVADAGGALHLVRVSPTGQTTLFYPSSLTAVPIPSAVTTALVVSQSGLVLFASPATNQVYLFDKNGQLLGSFSDPLLSPPRGFALVEGPNMAYLFVSSEVAGTVVRLDFQVSPQGWRQVNSALVGSGFQFPQGLAYLAASDQLFVAEGGTHRIRVLNQATTTRGNQGVGTLVPPQPIGTNFVFGLAATPNQHLLVSSSFLGTVTELKRTGSVVRTLSLDPAQGELTVTGVAVKYSALTATSHVAMVDSKTKSLWLWTIP